MIRLNRMTKDVTYSFAIVLFLYAVVHNPITHPTPEPLSGNWSIQFMQHPLIFGFAGHNYLALRDGNGAIVSELHGLATDSSTGGWKYMGSSPADILKVWEFDSSHYYISEKSFPGIILAQGNEADIRNLWTEGEKCIDPINAKNLPYPPYGFSLKNETVNSNSVAYTLASCMHLDTRHIGILTPGSAKNLLP
jgi:hypothetical protein